MKSPDTVCLGISKVQVKKTDVNWSMRFSDDVTRDCELKCLKHIRVYNIYIYIYIEFDIKLV